jgi:hypothetical protein
VSEASVNATTNINSAGILAADINGPSSSLGLSEDATSGVQNPSDQAQSANYSDGTSSSYLGMSPWTLHAILSDTTGGRVTQLPTSASGDYKLQPGNYFGAALSSLNALGDQLYKAANKMGLSDEAVAATEGETRYGMEVGFGGVAKSAFNIVGGVATLATMASDYSKGDTRAVTEDGGAGIGAIAGAEIGAGIGALT